MYAADQSPLNELHPWQMAQWQRIVTSHEAGRLPHAILLTGPAGTGKSTFAKRVASGLLCTETNLEEGGGCGTCQSCQLFSAGSHPDYTRLEPEEQGKTIKIDSVREFTAKEALTSQSGGYKVIIIEPADAMNIAASNSLLKTLEEPTTGTLMILVSSLSHKLPATIRSRCQTVHFPTPDRTVSEAWLEQQLPSHDVGKLLNYSNGSPLQALALSQDDLLALRTSVLADFSKILTKQADPIEVAAKWNNEPLERLIPWLNSWLMDMIRLKSLPNGQELTNVDQKQDLQASVSAIELRPLYTLMDKLLEMSRTLGAQLNSQMLIEDFLLTCIGTTNRRKN